MAVLNDKVVSDLKRIFSKELGTKKVKLLAFTSDSPECQYCDVTTKLVEEIGKVDERIDVEIFEFDDDEKVVEKYEIEMTPAIIVLGEDGK
ncbi:MAG: glutaredoxin, partial [Thermotoga sp.]